MKLKQLMYKYAENALAYNHFLTQLLFVFLGLYG